MNRLHKGLGGLGLFALGTAFYAGLSLNLVLPEQNAGMMRVGMSPVHAFDSSDGFKEPSARGGGDGRYFTGSLRDGFTCGVCHQSKTYFKIEVTGLDDAIKPGKTYELKVEWEGESSRVSFNAEVVDAKGFAAGTVKPSADKNTFIAEQSSDKRQPFGMFWSDDRKESEVVFQWTAPDEVPEGPISVHVSAIRKEDVNAKGNKSKPKEDEPPKTSLDHDELAVFAAQYPFKGSTKKAKE